MLDICRSLTVLQKESYLCEVAYLWGLFAEQYMIFMPVYTRWTAIKRCKKKNNKQGKVEHVECSYELDLEKVTMF